MQQQGIPRLGRDSWRDLFLDLANHCNDWSFLVAFDESAGPAFSGQSLKLLGIFILKKTRLMLIISGSNLTWIKKNILSNRGFVGRIFYRLWVNQKISAMEFVRS
ncbi:MAG: hypothetical protein H0T62_00325 [Parachlamydiaceae bacterium]|nr:hypothetical protein [Parachlamydiaceae bacterium]